MLVRDVPVADRPRERLVRLGTDALSDRELLAVLLRTGTDSDGVHGLAERLLAEFGSLGSLARSAPTDLMRISGVGHAKAASLLAAFELGRRIDRVDARIVLDSSAAIAAAARPSLSTRSRERVLVLSCDTRLRLLGTDIVSEGGAGAASLPVREILAAVLRRDGTSFALAHNHPGGDPTPSPADAHATDDVVDAAAHVGLRLLDHVIVAGNQWRSVTAAR